MFPRFAMSLTAAAALLLAGAAPLAADPPHGKGRKGGKDKFEYEYEREDDGKVKVKIKGNPPPGVVFGAPVVLYEGAGGPPPWAPAHGYRRKHAGQEVYTPPFGLDAGRCNRDSLGAVIGAAAGGLVGSQFGKGDGQIAAVIGGTVLGALMGNNIGRSMDQADAACVAQVLEFAPERQQIAWQNPDNGASYQVVPTRTFQTASGYCREYQTTVVIGGRQERAYGTACRQPDGAWQPVR